MPAAIAIPMLISAGVSAYGAHQASSAAHDAANQQSAATASAAALQAPYRAAGLDALNKLQGMQPFQAPDSVTEQNDPGYQFRLQQGEQGINRAAAAQGVSGGGALKALDRYNQNYASNEYGNVYGRAFQQYQQTYNNYAQLAGMGAQAGNNQGELGIQGANAQAAGTVAGSNAWSSALGGISNNLSFLSLLKATQAPTTATQSYTPTAPTATQSAPMQSNLNRYGQYPWAQPLGGTN